MEIVDESVEELSVLDDNAAGCSRQFRCTECKKYFKNDRALILHMKSHNAQRSGKNGDLYVCQQCGKTAKTRQALDRHAAYHQDERPFPCEKCEQRFKNSDDRGKHYRRLKRDGKFEYACKVCHKHFKSDELLRKHQVMLGCLSNTDFPEKQKVPNENKVIEEVENLDKADNTFKVNGQNADSSTDIKLVMCHCKMCELDFQSPELLKEHYRTYHKDSKRQVCIQCGQTLSSRDSLNRHYNIFHQDVFPYPCKKCDQQFKVKESLLRHTKFVHSDGGYTCAICKHVFSQPVNLKKHMVMHSTKNNLMCNDGGKTFKGKQSLEKHCILVCNKSSIEPKKNNANTHDDKCEKDQEREIIDMTEYTLDNKETEWNSVVQSKIDVPLDKSVESFDAMDLILDTNDEAVPIGSQNDIHHNKASFVKESPEIEIIDTNDQQFETVVDNECESNIGNTIGNNSTGLILENHFQTNKSMSETINVDNINISDNVVRSQVNDEVCETLANVVRSDKVQSSRNNKNNDDETRERDFYEKCENLSTESLEKRKEQEVYKDPTEELFPEKYFSKCKKSSEGENSEHLCFHDDTLSVAEDCASKDKQINDTKDVVYQQNFDCSHKTKNTFKPSNLPLILAPIQTYRSEKPEEVGEKIADSRIKEMINSPEIRTNHQRIQKNPFIIQNVSDKMDTENSNGGVLDLSTTHSSRQSPKTNEEIPSGKFSLIKHMLSLQNEEHFDKSLFDNPLYNKPSRIHDFKKLAEMHKISNNVNIEEYDLSAKQNIPIHWLGLSRQNKLESRGNLVNTRQSCAERTITSVSTSDCFDKRVPKRASDEDRPSIKVQRVGDRSKEEECDGGLKSSFAASKVGLLEKVLIERRQLTSLSNSNLESCKSGVSATNELIDHDKLKNKPTKSQTDSDLMESTNISNGINSSDTFPANIKGGNYRNDKLPGKRISVTSALPLETFSVEKQKIKLPVKALNGDGCQRERWNNFDHKETGDNNGIGEDSGNILDFSAHSPVTSFSKQIGNNSPFHRSKSETCTFVDGISNVSPKVSCHLGNSNTHELNGALSMTVSSAPFANRITECMSTVSKQNFSTLSRSVSWPQHFGEDSPDFQNNHFNENNFKHRDSKMATSFHIETTQTSRQNDTAIEHLEENAVDLSEVLLARSLDTMGDISNNRIASHLKPLDITAIPSSHQVPFPTSTSQTYISKQTYTCSKSSLISLSLQGHLNHHTAQQNIAYSGYNGAIGNTNVSRYNSQCDQLNLISNRPSVGFDGLPIVNKTGNVEKIEFLRPTSIKGRYMTENVNNTVKTISCSDLTNNRPNLMYSEGSFAWKSVPMESSRCVFGNKRPMAQHVQEGLSVMDLLQIPGGTSKMKKHQNIEQFMKHCLD